MKYYRSTLHSDQVICSADNFSVPLNPSPVSLVLLLFPERPPVYLYCDKLKCTSHLKHSFLPTLSPPSSPISSTLLHFSLSFCSTFFLFCFQNSYPFLGLSFRLVYNCVSVCLLQSDFKLSAVV